MTTFVLILTFAYGQGNSMTSVPGFESDAACQAAGQLWAQNIPKPKVGFDPRVSFVCVGQKK